MVSILYILNEQGEPIPTDDPVEWAEWFSVHFHERVIAHDRDESGTNAILISTVFTGINSAFSGPPILWESMIFGGPLNNTCQRYTSRDAAIIGHQVLCNAVMQTLKDQS